MKKEVHLSNFDKILSVGIGIGLVVLCCLGMGFWAVSWRERPNQGGELDPTPTTSTAEATAPAGLSPASTTVTPSPTSVPSPTAETSPTSATAKIAFTCRVDGIHQICLMNADGSGRIQLTEAELTSFYASIAPDGKTIVFSSMRTGNFEIFEMGLDGENVQQLTSKIGGLYAPEISPDGTRIVFANHTKGNQSV